MSKQPSNDDADDGERSTQSRRSQRAILGQRMEEYVYGIQSESRQIERYRGRSRRTQRGKTRNIESDDIDNPSSKIVVSSQSNQTTTTTPSDDVTIQTSTESQTPTHSNISNQRPNQSISTDSSNISISESTQRADTMNSEATPTNSRPQTANPEHTLDSRASQSNRPNRRTLIALATQNQRRSIRDMLDSVTKFIGKPSTEVLKEYETNAHAARLFLYDHTAFDIHGDHFDGYNCGNPFSGDVSSLKKMNPVEEETIKSRCKKFLNEMQPDLSISKCASCGVKRLGDVFQLLPLHKLGKLLLDPRTARAKRFLAMDDDDEIKQCFTIFQPDQAEKVYYDLHTRLMKKDSNGCFEAPLCPHCYRDIVKRKKRPEFNVGSGFDFGQYPAGLQLSMAEQIVVARALRIQTCIKFVDTDQEHMKGHCIFLPHDGNTILAQSLPSKQLDQLPISVTFIGKKSVWKKMTSTDGDRKRFIESNAEYLNIRPDVVFRWLKLKKMIDPTCEYDIDESEETIAALQKMPELILLSAEIIDSIEGLRAEKATSDNIAAPKATSTVQPETNQASTNDSHEAILESIFIQPNVQPAAIADITLMQVFSAQLSQVRTNLSQLSEINNQNDSAPVENGDDLEFTIQNLENDSTGDDETSGPSHNEESRTIPESDVPARETIQIPVRTSAFNEFKDNANLFYSSFGHLFLLGEGAPKRMTSSQAQINHMLDQYDGRFANSPQLLFTLFNQLQRGVTARQVSLRVRGNHNLMKKFAKIVNEEGFVERLEDAIRNPDKKESKALIRLVNELITISGTNIPYSQMERNSAYPKILAMKRFFGAFSFFVTISPADMDSILTMRLSNMEDVDCDEWNIPIKLPENFQRMKLLAKNSMAAATIYQKTMEIFFSELIGLDPTHLTRSSASALDDREEGVLGVPIAFASVTEFQSRGSPHSHFLLFTDISPLTIQMHLDKPGFIEKFAQRVDSMIKCHLPEDLSDIQNVQSHLAVEEETPVYRDHRIPVPVDSFDELMKFGDTVACGTNVHSHSATCHKGHSGDRSCRMAMPRPCSNDPTCCVQLELVNEDNYGRVQVRALKNIEPRDNQYQDEPLMKRYDERIIVVQPSRPGRSIEITDDSTSNDRYRPECPQGPNGNVVAFSPPITACLRCNTNVEILGNACQEKCSLFYTINYITKSAYKTDGILSILRGAKRHTEQYPSIADDTGEYMRNAQHLLTRVLNMQYGSSEISLQGAVLALRGFPSNVFSHEFFYCFVRPAIAAIHRLNGNPEVIPSTQDNNIELQDSANSNPIQMDIQQPRALYVDRDVDEEHGQNNNDDENYEFDEARQIVTDSEGKIRAVAQHEHYMYRGEGLKDFSFYEYCSIICITKKSKKKESNDEASSNSTASQSGNNQTETTNASGRIPNATYEFTSEHPLHLTHVQQLRSKQRIPVLAGPAPPPHPGPRTNSRRWKQAADDFSEYVLILHHPWSLETYRPDVELSYEGLSEWIHTMEQSPYFEDKCRLFWMENLAQGMKIDTDTLKVMTAWRARCARVWSANDNMIHLSTERVVEKSHHLGISQELQMDADLQRRLLNPDGIPSKSARQAELLAENIFDMVKDVGVLQNPSIRQSAILDETEKGAFQEVFERISKGKDDGIETFEEQHEQSSDDSSDEGESQPDEDSGQNENLTMEENLNLEPSSLQIEDGHELAPQDTVDRALEIQTRRHIRNCVPTTPIQQLNEKQNDVLVRISQWFNDTQTGLYPPNSDGIKLLLSGAAGTGKSFLVRKIVERLGIEQIRCVSFQGVAASLLPGGNTIHTTFAISTNKEYAINSKTCRRARKNFGNAVLLIIDEISNTSPQLFYSIDRRLRDWFDRTKPFGGIGVLAMGDMFQMPPVRAKSLVHAASEFGDYAGELFDKFEMVTLTKPMRSDEPELLKILDCYRNPEISMTPVKQSQTLKEIQRLKREDFEADPKWFEATIIVSDNVTRITLNRLQARLYAKMHNQPVICWRNTLSQSSMDAFVNFALEMVHGNRDLLDDYLNRTLDSLPDMNFYFVKGAPASLKDNIWTTAGLCNGSMCILHSLTLTGEDAEQDRKRIGEAQPGDEVFLASPPLCINVELTEDHADLARYSIVPEKIVIPLMLQSKSKREFYNAKQDAGNSFQDRATGKLYYYDFGVDLAFAVTYHKVQGRTLDRVIVDLNSAKSLTVSAIYVSISRTRKQEHIRFLDLIDGTVAEEKLNGKTFDTILVKWLARKTNNSKLMKMIQKWKQPRPTTRKGRKTSKSEYSGNYDGYSDQEEIEEADLELHSERGADEVEYEQADTFKAKRRKAD